MRGANTSVWGYFVVNKRSNFKYKKQIRDVRNGKGNVVSFVGLDFLLKMLPQVPTT